MPSNLTLNSGSGGSSLTTKQRTHDGDTTQCQSITIAGVSGTEDSYTFVDVQAGGGTEANALRVTIANDSTGVLSVDDNGGSLTVDGTVTLGANSGVDIGDVDVTSLIPGTGATNLGKAVDSPSGGTDTGIAALAIRDDALSTLTPIEGDYVPLRVNSTGALHVTGGGGGTEYNEDDATPNPIVGTATLMERDDALSTVTPIEGDWIGLRGNARGALWTTIDGTVTVDGSATTQPVSGTVTANAGSGTFTVDSELPAAAALADAAANPTTPTTGSALLGYNGTTWDRLRSTTANGLDVDVTRVQGTVTVDGSGVTQPVSGTVTANAGTGTFTVDLGANNDVQGMVAHDSPVANNPFLLAAEARTTTPTAVANGDVVRLQADDQGRLIVEPHAPRDRVTTNRIALTTTTETTLIAAGGAGVFRDLVSLVLSNESAAETRVDIRDSSAGTIRYSVDLAADGGGAVINLPVPHPQATANNAWTAQLSAASSTVYISAITVDRA